MMPAKQRTHARIRTCAPAPKRARAGLNARTRTHARLRTGLRMHLENSRAVLLRLGAALAVASAGGGVRLAERTSRLRRTTHARRRSARHPPRFRSCTTLCGVLCPHS
eukprot:2314222-Pleurochrysis_carterae.AAC.1